MLLVFSSPKRIINLKYLQIYYSKDSCSFPQLQFFILSPKNTTLKQPLGDICKCVQPLLLVLISKKGINMWLLPQLHCKLKPKSWNDLQNLVKCTDISLQSQIFVFTQFYPFFFFPSLMFCLPSQPNQNLLCKNESNLFLPNSQMYSLPF